MKDYEKLIEEALNANPTRLSYMRTGFSQDDYLKMTPGNVSGRGSVALSYTAGNSNRNSVDTNINTVKGGNKSYGNKSNMSFNGKLGDLSM